MSDRPILSLKPRALAQPAAPAPSRWKCKPCGAAFEVAPDSPAEHVRCPKCNARLGLTADFLSDPPKSQRLRARVDTSKPVDPPKPTPALIVTRASIRRRPTT
ncbi:MAG TPA: hypothetical protein VHN73_03460 [Phenylobacterium sp.]|nr:hypothetical protein [Phenylobacterium sp.]